MVSLSGVGVKLRCKGEDANGDVAALAWVLDATDKLFKNLGRRAGRLAGLVSKIMHRGAGHQPDDSARDGLQQGMPAQCDT